MLSSRAIKFLDILKDDGHIERRIENDFRGYPKVVYKFYDGQHQLVKGYGMNTFYDLNEAYCISMSYSTSSVSTYYVLNKNYVG